MCAANAYTLNSTLFYTDPAVTRPFSHERVGLGTQLLQQCVCLQTVECHWISKNTECHVVMVTQHDCVSVYTCIHNQYYMSTLLSGGCGGTASLDC